MTKIKVKVVDLDTRLLNFGKYKGRTPESIARDDPSYIVWLWNTVHNPPVSRELMLACEMDLQDRDPDFDDADSPRRFGEDN
jgi:hypothetical protein